MTVFTLIAIHRPTGTSYIEGTYRNEKDARYSAYLYMQDEPAPDKQQWIGVVILQTTFKDYGLPVTTIIQ